MFSLTIMCLLGVGMEWLAASLVCRPRLYGRLRLGRSGLLRSLRQYVRGGGGGDAKDITPSIAWRRGAERGSVSRSSLKGREKAIVSQTNNGTVSKTTLWKLPRDGLERIYGFPNVQILS